MLEDRLDGMNIVVTGGAGFLGSHLCTRLMAAGARVTAIDNLITGKAANLDHLVGRAGFRFVKYDVTDYLHVPGPVDAILHFASPASPVDYLELPIQTLKVGALGTHKALGLAREKGARLLLASTSEVYGDPQVHPQPESYWGHVNPIGPRGVYDEAKRFAEAMTYAYHRAHGLDVRVVRIFNSVLADEQVLFDDGRELRREPIRDLAARIGDRADLENYAVPSFAADGTAVAGEAIALEGHPTSATCFEVRTRYGRSIRVTGDHSLFVEGVDGEPVARPVSELGIGDRVAIAGRIEVPERDRATLRITDAWDALGYDSWDLAVRSPAVSEAVWARRFELLPALCARRGVPATGVHRQGAGGRISRMVRADRVPLWVVRRLAIDVPNDATVSPHRAGARTELPWEIPLTDEFLWFLGLFVAEGCWAESPPKSHAIIVSCDEDTLDRAEKIVRRDLGLHVVRTGGKKGRGGYLAVNSTLLLAVLRHLGFGDGVKRIPGWILGLPLSRLKWFIEGYREGDGVHSGKKFDEGIRHEFSTTSEELKDDLVVAFGRFGLVPSIGRYASRIRKKTGDRRSPFWRLTLPHVSPWDPLEWDRGVEQRLNARRTGDLVWAAVKEIEEVPATDLVYDFCVPGLENFWAGTGVMAHNTYGERMRPDDGRAVPTFIGQALRNESLTVHGDGTQTRSLCYVDDLVEGILRLLVSSYTRPVNLGNPHEVTMNELAEAIQDAVGNHPGITHTPRPQDDPEVRQPEITVAERELGWRPRVDLAEGLARTVAWFRDQVVDEGH